MKRLIFKLTFIALTSVSAINFAYAQSGLGYYIEVENPAAFVQALTALNESSAAASTNTRTGLSVAVANGGGAATHFVSVQGSTLDDIDRLRQDSQATSQEFATFTSAIRNNATPAAELVFNSLGVHNGKASVVTSPNAYHWHIHLLVTDMPAYLEALEVLMEANSGGNVYMHAYQTFGTGLGGGNLVVVNSANSLEELLNNNQGYDEFIENTINIRTPIANGIYQTITNWD
ncbi:MAG: hypothetical protein ACJZ8R_09770 [Pseudohongiellaceae bacterium]